MGYLDMSKNIAVTISYHCSKWVLFRSDEIYFTGQIKKYDLIQKWKVVHAKYKISLAKLKVQWQYNYENQIKPNSSFLFKFPHII